MSARAAFRARVSAIVEGLRHGQHVVAEPISVRDPIQGVVVDVDDLVVALLAPDGEVVWVHGADIRTG